VSTDDAILQALLESNRAQAKALERASVREAELRAEIHKLVSMVEGLTGQLDQLLKDRDEERRAKLAELRKTAQEQAETASPPKSSPKPSVSKSATKKGRHAHGRKAKPEHLPRDTETRKVTACSGCGGDNLLAKDQLVLEEYDYVRAHVRVRRTLREVCICADCNKRTTATPPPMPMNSASCTMRFVAWLLFAKAGLFLPLDRLRRDFKEQGAPLASSTLTRWWSNGADMLHPIAQAVRHSLLRDAHIRTDGTGLVVVFTKKKGKPVRGPKREGEVDEDGWLTQRGSVRGQVLVFGNDDHAVYLFTGDKKGHHAMDFLTLGKREDGSQITWSGTITADALSAHDQLFTDGSRIEAGCNAHGFRKFRDHASNGPLIASKAIGFIAGFYKVEAEAKEKELTGAELLAYRQAHAGPIATEFKTWLNKNRNALLDTNPVFKAMRYYRKHWDALTRFLTDPDVELDNNWSERALRKVALIRNNSMYAGDFAGAERLCTLLTLINTCRLHDVDPYEYLTWALTKVVPHVENRGLVASDLTPMAYKALQQ